ncbi:hypothetical protein BY996DRAFT_6420907 [Phakopsora pachyrhizi]|nr:hypothetical protein BY996DRAFT_6420907 [Phakopsora pachyrhizi]
MRERLKKKGQEGKVEAFVKGLNSGSFDVVNYDYLPVSHKFTGGNLLDKVENKTINGGKTDGLLDAALNGKGKAPELNGGDTQVEELSTNLEAEGKEYEDPEEQISNGLVDPNASLTLPSDLRSLIGESMKGRGGVNDIVILPPSENSCSSKAYRVKNWKKKKLHWVGWVTFLPDTDMKEAKRRLSESKFQKRGQKKREREIVRIRPVLPLLDKYQKEIIMGDTMLISPVQQVSLVMMGQHRTPDL